MIKQLSLIYGSMKAATLQDASKYVDSILAKLVWRLHHERINNVKRSGNVVFYKRGYRLVRGDRSPLAMFDPGLFSIIAEHYTIEVRYRLGLSPLYMPLGAGIVLLIIWQIRVKQYTIYFAIIFCAVLGVSLIVGIVRFRAWLKEAIQAAISEV